ncbi:MAG: hypothetical protein GX045_11940 [Clostridiaceae bacterium]|nr:hypothetical protein [Clostridiaceae bacterium]
MDFNFLLLNLSFVLLLGILIYVASFKQKKQIHYAFISMIISILIWTFGYLGLFYGYFTCGYDLTFFIKIILTGVVITPLTVYYLGYIFAYTKIRFTIKHIVLYIIPLISLILIYTNEYHGLFYTYFSAENVMYRAYGSWSIIHIIYSYALILIGLCQLLYFTIKNSGFFSNQSKLIILGIIIPFSINILITFQIRKVPYYYESISFSIAVIFFTFAIFKFQFLNITPIALQRIVDLISDSYIVINDNFDIIDYNKTFIDTFNSVLSIKRNEKLIDTLKINSRMNLNKDLLFDNINYAIEKRRTVSFEQHIEGKNFDRHFSVEITPIYSNDSTIGTIILLKDITDHKRNIETIKRNQQILMERERLAFLGELIGGIAHNLKTPIMSVSGGLEGLYDLIEEYDESIDDINVTSEDHHQIAKEMKDWIFKLKPHLSYMSEVISTVKDQAVHLSAVTSYSFSLNELVKRIEILVKNKLKIHHCMLNLDVRADDTVEIFGDISSLVQVLDNIIINAIEAYNGARGEIDLIIEKVDENNILFTIKDYAYGMDEEVKNKLFKQMLTTKGKDGTGLGLYMSYSTIKGRFGGSIWFESEKGSGTTFYIQIPRRFENNNNNENQTKSVKVM